MIFPSIYPERRRILIEIKTAVAVFFSKIHAKAESFMLTMFCILSCILLSTDMH